MPEFSAMLWVVIVTALLFDFVNGWNDSANAIATVVGTRVLSPLKAVLLAAVLNMAGAYMGTEVAKMVGGGLVEAEMISQTVLVAAMCGAILWAAAMTMVGMPISGSHSLIGGLLGASVAKAGIHVVITHGVLQTLVAMLVSPVLGFAFAFLMYLLISALFRHRAPGPTGRMFGYLQIGSVSGMALMHGANDAQKVMGIIMLALVLGEVMPSMEAPIPNWVIFSCGMAISLGTALGGWKVIKTLGHGLSRLKPVDGFAAETAASLVLFGVKELGVPVSTTHTITGAILGVGASKGIGAVKWGLGQKIVLAWIFTLPSTMAIGGMLYWVLWAGVGLDHQPEAPFSVRAVARAGEVELVWSEVRSAESYSVYRYDRIGVEQEAEKRKVMKKGYLLRDPETERRLAHEIKDNRILDVGLEPGRTYVYCIVARNEFGRSAKSKELVVEIPAPEPAAPVPATP